MMTLDEDLFLQEGEHLRKGEQLVTILPQLMIKKKS
jgi:hypothetical protein